MDWKTQEEEETPDSVSYSNERIAKLFELVVAKESKGVSARVIDVKRTAASARIPCVEEITGRVNCSPAGVLLPSNVMRAMETVPSTVSQGEVEEGSTGLMACGQPVVSRATP